MSHLPSYRSVRHTIRIIQLLAIIQRAVGLYNQKFSSLFELSFFASAPYNPDEDLRRRRQSLVYFYLPQYHHKTIRRRLYDS